MRRSAPGVKTFAATEGRKPQASSHRRGRTGRSCRTVNRTRGRALDRLPRVGRVMVGGVGKVNTGRGADGRFTTKSEMEKGGEGLQVKPGK